MGENWPNSDEHAWILKNFEALDRHPLRYDASTGSCKPKNKSFPIPPGELVRLNPKLLK
jgi:hypothetical protein